MWILFVFLFSFWNIFKEFWRVPIIMSELKHVIIVSFRYPKPSFSYKCAFIATQENHSLVEEGWLKRRIKYWAGGGKKLEQLGLCLRRPGKLMNNTWAHKNACKLMALLTIQKAKIQSCALSGVLRQKSVFVLLDFAISCVDLDHHVFCGFKKRTSCKQVFSNLHFNQLI